MNNEIFAKILPAIIKSKGEAQITVIGVSMQPTLYEGDEVTIKSCDQYEVGDILVFSYKNEGILIHRLLKKNSRYFCKGDNAFRLEDIELGQIIGKAVAVNQKPIPAWQDWKINLSYLVNREFVKLHYKREETIKTNIYKLYQDLILRKEEKIMNYKKTEKMDYILSDETSLAVFDPQTGDTYFFDETGIDILNCLSEPCDLETLIDKLCDIYDATPNDIRDDVEEFLAETVEKGVVEIV